MLLASPSFSTTSLAEKFVFKGGTSLSRVFGIIRRFSEDIDLSVDPDWLGFGGENRPDAARSRSQFQKRCKKLNDVCAAAVDQEVRPMLEQAIQHILGPKQDGGTCLAFKVDEQTQWPELTFQYPTTEPRRPGYAHPQAKLEPGVLTDQRPIGGNTVTLWVAEEFPALFAAPVCRVVALEVERTFWEKVTILHSEYRLPADKPMRSRLSTSESGENR